MENAGKLREKRGRPAPILLIVIPDEPRTARRPGPAVLRRATDFIEAHPEDVARRWDSAGLGRFAVDDRTEFGRSPSHPPHG